MRIILIRHADAVSEGAGLPDEDRYLSDRGRRQARDLGALLAGSGVAVGQIVTSPLARALQTAELVAAVLDCDDLEVTGELSPAGADMRQTPDSLARRAGAIAPDALIAVGHEPSISALAQRLGSVRVGAFRKAEACYIEDGAIVWRRAPD